MRILIIILITAGMIFFSYLTLSMVEVSFNIVDWREDVRSGLAFMMFFSLLLAVARDDIKNK